MNLEVNCPPQPKHNVGKVYCRMVAIISLSKIAFSFIEACIKNE